MKWLFIVGGAVVVAVLGYFFIYTPLQQTSLDEVLEMNEQTVVSNRVPVEQTLAHPASGFVRVVEEGGKTYIRYEDFYTINGPDLFVYLATDKDATTYVDLGRLKATQGNINYEIPGGVTVADYPYVLVWCKAFSVLFNAADISSIHN